MGKKTSQTQVTQGTTAQCEQCRWRPPSNILRDCPEDNTGQVTQVPRGQYPHGRRKQMADVGRIIRENNKGLLLQHKPCSRRHVCDNNISPSGVRCYLWYGANGFHYKPASASEFILVLNQKAT